MDFFALTFVDNCEINTMKFCENFQTFSLSHFGQIGDEVNGMIMVRSAEGRQGVCPAKYLQEV